MPAPLVVLLGYAASNAGLVALGGFLVANAAIISAVVMVVGGLAYSASKARKAAAEARDAFNAAQVDRLVTITSAVAPRDLVLGRARKAGTLFYKASTGTHQKDFYMAIALAGHEIDGIEEIYLADERVQLDASGNVIYAYDADGAQVACSYAVSTTKTGTSTGYPTHANLIPESVIQINAGGLASGAPTGTYSYQYAETDSKAKITYYLGAAGQGVDPDLHAAFPDDWGSTDVVQGVAYLVCKFTYSETAFPSGLPNVTAVIRGARVFDPRSSLTAWSENPALLMRHVYQHPRFGKGSVTPTEDARFIAAANACDITGSYTTLAGSSVAGVVVAAYTEAMPLYRASLVVNFGATARSVFDDLSQAMGGSWAFAGGELYLKPGVYVAPIKTLGDVDLAVVTRAGASETQVPISISVHQERQAKFNTVKATIWDAAQAYKQVALTPLVGAALVARDGGELVQSVTFPAISYAPQALHIAGVMMRDARDPLVVDLPFKLSAYALELFDTVSLTLSRYGWASKTFMILGRVWNVDGSIQLTLKETSAAITQMDSGFQPQGFAPNTNLPSPWVVPKVQGMAVTFDTLRQRDGTMVSRMIITWIQVADAAVVQNGQVEIQYRKSDETGAWTSIVVPGNETQATTTDIQDGVIYIVRARARTSVAVGDWNVQVETTAGGQVVPPLAITSLTAVGGLWEIVVSWTFNPAEIDLDYLEIWGAQTNNRDVAVILTSAKYPLASWHHTGLGPGVGWYYWARAIDTSTNVGPLFPVGVTAGVYGVSSTDTAGLLDDLIANLNIDQIVTDLATPLDAAVLAAAGAYTDANTYTRATVDGNIAGAVQVVSARLDTGDYAAVKTSATASASAITGLNAQYSIQVDTNGHVAGMALNSGGGTSSVVFLADKFAFVAPDGSGTPKTVMAVGYIGGAYTFGLNGNMIVDGSVLARSIDARGLTIRDTAGNAILTAGSSVANSSFAIPGNVSGVPAGWLNSNIDLSGVATAAQLAAKLNNAAASNLSGVITLNTNGMILAGNTSTGVYLSPGGLTAVRGGVPTLTLNAATGDAVFGGTMSATAVNAVDTINIAGHAVTIPVSAYTAGSLTFSAQTTLQQITITSKGYPIYITGAFSASGNSAARVLITKLYRGTTEINLAKGGTTYNGGTSLMGSITCTDTPGVGTFTYYMKSEDSASSWTVTNRTLFALETLR